MADQNENSNPSPETMNDEEHPTEEESKDPPKVPVSNEPPTEEESKDPPEEPAPNENEETPMVTEIEVLNEQFENYMRIAKSLMKTLKRPKDIEICGELLRKVQYLNESRHLEVKRNNNRFFRYCLRILKWTSENQPLHLYRQWYNLDDCGSEKELDEQSKWLIENKSYMASKTFKDGTTLIYMAVANDTEAGWEPHGFRMLEQHDADECS